MKKLFISLILICFLVSNAYAIVMGYSRTFGGAPSAYLFDWDATTTTADIYGSGTLVGTLRSIAELSSTQYNSAPTSLNSPTGFDTARFTDSGIYNTTNGTITIYSYGNFTDGYDSDIAQFYGDISNLVKIETLSTDRVRIVSTLNGVTDYIVSTASQMLTSQWNKIYITYEQSGGDTQTDYTLSINDNTATTGSNATVWDIGVAYTYTDIGIFSGSAATAGATYVDDITITD